MTVFIPEREKKAGIYYVQFRYVRNGKITRVYRSTREKRYDLAEQQGAAIFAAEVRKADDTKVETQLDFVSDQLAAIYSRLDNLPSSGDSVNSIPGALREKKLIREGVEEFILFKQGQVAKGELSASQMETLAWKNRSFASFCQQKGFNFVQDVTEQVCIDWLDSRKVTKSAKGYLGDIGNFLNWSTLFPRKWLAKSPISLIGKGRKSYGRPKVLTLSVVVALMEWLELELPQFVAFYAIAIFAGVRQDKKDGELKRLAECVARKGWSEYLSDEHLVVPHPKVGKDARDFPMSENLKHWLALYPHLEVPSAHMHRKIIKRFHIPYNGMRHTAISAYVISTGNTDLASFIFNTSLTMMKRHYVTLMKEDDVQAFYQIAPQRRAAINAKASAA